MNDIDWDAKRQRWMEESHPYGQAVVLSVLMREGRPRTVGYIAARAHEQTAWGYPKYTNTLWAAEALAAKGLVTVGFRKPGDRGGGSHRMVSPKTGSAT